MIHADVRGKLNANSTSRSEDVLTSNVLGLLRLVPSLLQAFLMRARRVTLTREEVVVGDPGTGVDVGPDLDLVFWQRLGRHGEIDAVVVEGPMAHPVRLIGLEAKYESGKSDAQRTAIDDDEPSDQLEEYWRGLHEHAFTGPAKIGRPGNREVQLVYITAHLAAPLKALGESLRALHKRGHQAQLAWLSWRDIVLASDGLRDLTEARIADDLKTLLEHKGLVPFAGMANLQPPKLPLGFHFFHATEVSCRAPSPLPSPTFWRSVA